LEPEHRFTIAMFALRPGVKMPLHDHPNMFVLSHVMNGVGERESWDVDPSDHHQ
jgi:cysteamine dioxygenase